MKKLMWIFAPVLLVSSIARAQWAAETLDASLLKTIGGMQSGKLVLGETIELREARRVSGGKRELVKPIDLTPEVSSELENEKEALASFVERQRDGVPDMQISVPVNEKDLSVVDLNRVKSKKRKRMPVYETVPLREAITRSQAKIAQLKDKLKSCTLSLETDEGGFDILPKEIAIDTQKSKELSAKGGRAVMAFSFQDKGGNSFNGKISCAQGATVDGLKEAVSRLGADLIIDSKATRIREGNLQPAKNNPTLM